MSDFRLISPEESIALLSKVFEAGRLVACLEVQEDICFQKNQWLGLGKFIVHPPGDEGGTVEAPVEEAIRFGSYSWTLPSREEIAARVEAIYAHSGPKPRTEKQQVTHENKTRRALEAVMHCAVKCGFVNPIFDARSVAEMPFKRPTTVVVDTSAAMQGGLDFVVRHLYPMARIKIPAIVHMEILVMADRYLNWRRAPKKGSQAAATLLDHVTSQGTQRAILRLELHTDAEIERPRLGADPLRGVVQPDTDAEDTSLGLQVVQRSFADRLILETAIQHRDRLSPDHPIMVLTADQGLARMTLGEGLRPLFFFTPPLLTICGRTLPGTGFRPFVQNLNESSLFYIPLPSLLWELACTFGSARVVLEDGSTGLAVSAIGEDLSWHPYHSHDDLLWSVVTSPPPAAAPPPADHPPGGPPRGETPQAGHPQEGFPVEMQGMMPEPPLAPSDAEVSEETKANDAQTRIPDASGKSVKTSAGLTGSYRFPVGSMVTLAVALGRKGWISDIEGTRIVNLKTIRRYQDFRNFFVSGEFAEREQEGLRKLPAMDDLVMAIKTLDLKGLRLLFSRVRSFTAFLEELAVGHPKSSESITSIGKAAFTTYVGLSEICCAALDIPDEGIYVTPNSPPPSEFVPLALSVYKKLRGGEQYVLTGKWLEELARTHGIHPLNTRERLNESRTIGLIERYTEGSTPETQFERHNMLILEKLDGKPYIKKLNLYHGTFIIPDKASVSIRLEGKTHGTA